MALKNLLRGVERIRELMAEADHAISQAVACPDPEVRNCFIMTAQGKLWEAEALLKAVKKE